VIRTWSSDLRPSQITNSGSDHAPSPVVVMVVESTGCAIPNGTLPALHNRLTEAEIRFRDLEAECVRP
jgi:hypothetical protein